MHSATANAHEPARSGPSRRVLIVDDDRNFADALHSLLTLEGYVTAVAYNERQAREAVESFDAEVVLLDLRLEAGSGLDLIAPLKEQCPGLVCVLITGYAETEAAVEALRRGAYDFLRKPIGDAELLAVLDRAFERFRLEEAKLAVERALRESEELFSRTFHVSPGLFAISRPEDGTHYDVNKTWIETTGYSREEAMAHSVLKLGIWVDAKQRERFVEHLEKEGSVRDFEAKFRTKDGRELDVLVAGEYMEIHGEPRLLIVSHDITERKRADVALLESEHALRERVADLEEARRELEEQHADLIRLAEGLGIARDRAEAADRAKSEFLAAMSHELRTPLNAIIGFSEVIKDETFGPVGNLKYREYVFDIHESGQHLLGLISDILDLSKIESGTGELHEDTIEIPELVRATLNLVGQRAEQREIKLELELPDQLPALRADARKLKQILVNLLANAIKFTDTGGAVTLRVWCRMDSGYVFQVVDTGIGIAPEDIPKALSRFGQVEDGLNRRYEGAGLGLPLTKALVELHGGILDLQSEVGVGTTVTVRFPAERIVASLDNADSLDVEDGGAS